MSWYGWLSLSIALIGCFICWRYLFRFLYRDFSSAGEYEEWGNIVASSVLAFLLCSLWPVFLIARYTHKGFCHVLRGRRPNEVAKFLGGTTRTERKRKRIST